MGLFSMFVRNTVAADWRTRIGNRPQATYGQLRTFTRNIRTERAAVLIVNGSHM
jgi:hypothetical protein